MTVYLKLLHGRDDPNQVMDGWGFDGPLLGPFEALHATYATHIRCLPQSATGDELELRFHEDMLVYQGKYYGDFEVTAAPGDRKVPPDPDGINDDRAEWAAAALRHFQCITGTDYEDVLGDLLCDLMHWCDRSGFNFEAALLRARGHYQAETMGQGEGAD